MFGGGGGRVQPQLAQFKPYVVDDAMRLGRNLDLGLQELPSDMARPAEIGGLEQRVPRLRRHLECLCVRKKIFLLDAVLKQIVRREDARLPVRRNERAQPQYFVSRVESEFHGIPSLDLKLPVGLTL